MFLQPFVYKYNVLEKNKNLIRSPGKVLKVYFLFLFSTTLSLVSVSGAKGTRQIVGARSHRPIDRDHDRDCGPETTTFANQLSGAGQR